MNNVYSLAEYKEAKKVNVVNTGTLTAIIGLLVMVLK